MNDGNAINNINRRDVAWNYIATFLRIGGNVILLPFVLRSFPHETVGIWNIFTTIIAMSMIIDFGFSATFSRNVSYVISGIKELKSKGINTDKTDKTIDYGLLKGLINAMKWFYTRTAILLFAVLATGGTYYIYTVLKKYSGSHSEVYIAWAVLVLINVYTFFTFYYNSLMFGKGLVRRSLQISVVGKAVHLVVAITMILLHLNLIAIVSAQALSVIVQRIMFYRAIYTPDFKQKLRSATACAKRGLMRPILPNALKIGLNQLVGSLAGYSMILVGGIFFTLEDVASYGITTQIVCIIGSIAGIYWSTYSPKLYQRQVYADNTFTKRTYLTSCFIALLTYLGLGGGILLLGNWALDLIHSKTFLLPQMHILAALLLSMLGFFIGTNAGLEMAKNRVPFLNATIVNSALLLVVFFVLNKVFGIGVFSMIIAPIAGLCHCVWMRRTIRDLHFTRADFAAAYQSIYQSLAGIIRRIK